jgi:hypothetical protein
MCCEYLFIVFPVKYVLAYPLEPFGVAPLALKVQPPLKVSRYAPFVSTGFNALNLALADTPPNIGYIAVILLYNPLLTSDVNNVLVAADTVDVIPVPPASTTADK